MICHCTFKIRKMLNSKTSQRLLACQSNGTTKWKLLEHICNSVHVKYAIEVNLVLVSSICLVIVLYIDAIIAIIGHYYIAIIDAIIGPRVQWGPFLYNIGTNSITSVLETSHTMRFTVFADDNTPCIPATIWSDDTPDILRSFFCHVAQHNLAVNFSKCQELRVSFRRTGHPILPINPIEPSDCISILGFTLDNKLSFAKHIKISVKKAYVVLYQIARLRSFGYRKEELKLMFDALVFSRLTYGAAVWGGEPDYVLQLVDRVQRKAIRLGICDSYVPIKDFILRHDGDLLDKILSNPRHPLYSYIPRRTDYCRERMRERRPPVHATTRQKDLSIFPNRALKRF